MAQAEGEVRGEIEFVAMVIGMVMLRLGLGLGRRSRSSARAPQRAQESLADKNIGRFEAKTNYICTFLGNPSVPRGGPGRLATGPLETS